MCGLKVRFTQSPEIRGVFGYALRAEVVSSDRIPSKIFVYHQFPAGLDGNTFSEFDHVATPVDFQEIPEDAASEIVPWYRTSVCTIWLRNADDLAEAKQLLVDDIGALQRGYDVLNSANDFTLQTDVEFSGGSVTADGPGNPPHEDPIQQEIDEIKQDVDGKVSKDALDGVDIAVNTIDGLKQAVAIFGDMLGANIVSQQNDQQGQ